MTVIPFTPTPAEPAARPAAPPDRCRPDPGLPEWLQSRVAFARRCFQDRDGNPWQPRPYQIPSLESNAPRKIHRDGRDVGKTSEIEITACWAALALPGREMLITAPCHNHLEPLMRRLTARVRQIPELAESLAEHRVHPSWFLRFENGFILRGRVSGPRGINYQGMHVDWILVDEAQEMTDAAWTELHQALNTGGRRWVYGVPNGLRNGFYRLCHDPAAEHYHWPSTLNPEYTPEKDEELATLYGGRHTPAYIHRVLGEHGEPENAAFAMDDYRECVDPALPADVTAVEHTVPDPDTLPGPEHPGRYFLGADLGYARDPSELVIWEETPDGTLTARARLRARGLDYDAQSRLMAALDEKWRFARLVLDAGAGGLATAHHLLRRAARLAGRLHAVDFGAMIDTGTAAPGVSPKRNAKAFMTELIQQAMADRKVRWPRDGEREVQYAGHTFRWDARGIPRYSKGDDHIIDADRCAFFARWLDHHARERQAWAIPPLVLPAGPAPPDPKRPVPSPLPDARSASRTTAAPLSPGPAPDRHPASAPETDATVPADPQHASVLIFGW